MSNPMKKQKKRFEEEEEKEVEKQKPLKPKVKLFQRYTVLNIGQILSMREVILMELK